MTHINIFAIDIGGHDLHIIITYNKGFFNISNECISISYKFTMNAAIAYLVEQKRNKNFPFENRWKMVLKHKKFDILTDKIIYYSYDTQIFEDVITNYFQILKDLVEYN